MNASLLIHSVALNGRLHAIMECSLSTWGNVWRNVPDGAGRPGPLPGWPTGMVVAARWGWGEPRCWHDCVAGGSHRVQHSP